MITMDKKQQILHFYSVDELSLRDISRKLNVDRKTVTRLINAYEAHIKSNPESGIDEFPEIQIGSEDILNQLENAMEKGTKLPE